MSNLSERRTSPRQAVRRNRSLLEFAAPSGRRRIAASLLDISREGALVTADMPPSPPERVWVRMDEPAKTDWIMAVAVRLGESNRVGLRFVAPCPEDFLLAALLGIDLGPTLLGGPRPQSVDDFGL